MDAPLMSLRAEVAVLTSSKSTKPNLKRNKEHVIITTFK
jgi:hypothetical protein